MRIARLDKAPNMKEIKNIESQLKKIEKKSDIELSEKQKEAVKSNEE